MKKIIRYIRMGLAVLPVMLAYVLMLLARFVYPDIVDSNDKDVAE